MKILHLKKGFTLIELLVVISIIALILAVSMPNFLGARQRARDAQKKSALNEIKTALRLYYNDYNKYPADIGSSGVPDLIFGCGTTGTSVCDGSCAIGDFSAGGTACDSTATVYMKKLPLKSGRLSLSGNQITYWQLSSGDDFLLKVGMENASDPNAVTSRARCPGSAGPPVRLCGVQEYCVCAD